jgi:hypothetical protein
MFDRCKLGRARVDRVARCWGSGRIDPGTHASVEKGGFATDSIKKDSSSLGRLTETSCSSCLDGGVGNNGYDETLPKSCRA